MAKQIEKLDAEFVLNVTKPGYYSDGLGLYLQVSVWGTKSWLLRYTRHQKAHSHGLGATHTVSLTEARKRARKARQQLLDGTDPIAQKKAVSQAEKLKAAKVTTFEKCATAYIESHKSGWKNAKHADQWTNTLTTYAFPLLGKLHVECIDTALVMKVLEPIWSKKTETATRVRGRLESVLAWATVRKYREGDNPARWKGHLDQLLPARNKVQKVRHHPALPYVELPEFVKLLRQRTGFSALAMEFCILTACRTEPVIGALWTEFDLESRVWVIPAERMKMPREHRVPLSDRALEILKELQPIGGKYVFPGPKPDKPMSNNAMLALLERMVRGDITVHGFRSTFKDWATEKTDYPGEMSEMALAHPVGDKVEAAYRRGDLFEKRVSMMAHWAKFCGGAE